MRPSRSITTSRPYSWPRCVLDQDRTLQVAGARLGQDRARRLPAYELIGRRQFVGVLDIGGADGRAAPAGLDHKRQGEAPDDRAPPGRRAGSGRFSGRRSRSSRETGPSPICRSRGRSPRVRRRREPFPGRESARGGGQTGAAPDCSVTGAGPPGCGGRGRAEVLDVSGVTDGRHHEGAIGFMQGGSVPCCRRRHTPGRDRRVLRENTPACSSGGRHTSKARSSQFSLKPSRLFADLASQR